ncbi:NAD(P)-binding protein [Apiospora arundinis]
MVELGELVMIRKAAEEDDSSIASVSSPVSTLSSTADISSDLDKLDITSSGSAMSSVYGRNSNETGSTSNMDRGSGEGGGSGNAGGLGSSSPKRSSSFTSLFSKQHKRTSSQGSVKQQQQSQNNPPDHLARWLTSGNVIYKSVGLGLMDLVVGNEIIRLAKEKGVGHHIENFS